MPPRSSRLPTLLAAVPLSPIPYTPTLLLHAHAPTAACHPLPIPAFSCPCHGATHAHACMQVDAQRASRRSAQQTGGAAVHASRKQHLNLACDGGAASGAEPLRQLGSADGAAAHVAAWQQQHVARTDAAYHTLCLADRAALRPAARAGGWRGAARVGRGLGQRGGRRQQRASVLGLWRLPLEELQQGGASHLTVARCSPHLVACRSNLFRLLLLRSGQPPPPGPAVAQQLGRGGARHAGS